MGVSGTSLSRFELENGGSGTSLSRFERENAGSGTAANRGAAERLKMRISRTAASPRRCRTLEKCESPERPLSRGAAERAEPRPWEAMNGLKLKKILKMMVSGTAKSAKKCKMVMLRRIFW